ncbi:MAG: CBU_0592 family membrane protein [Micromonosporaceae bacterium]
MTLVVNVLGWVGAVGLLVAYALVSTGRLPAESARFQVTNVAGALALMVNSTYFGALPSAFLNVVWITIGFAALVRGFRRGRGQRQSNGEPDPQSHP